MSDHVCTCMRVILIPHYQRGSIIVIISISIIGTSSGPLIAIHLFQPHGSVGLFHQTTCWLLLPLSVEGALYISPKELEPPLSSSIILVAQVFLYTHICICVE